MTSSEGGDDVLGIDLGTKFSAAAIARRGRAEIVSLGHVTAVVPSVILVLSDGEVLVGEAAERRAASDPTRVAREFQATAGRPGAVGPRRLAVRRRISHGSAPTRRP